MPPRLFALALLACTPDPGRKEPRDSERPTDSPRDTVPAVETEPPDDTRTRESQVPHTGDTRPPIDTGDDTGTPIDIIAKLDPWVEPDVLVVPTPLTEGSTATVTYRGPLAAAAKALQMPYGFDDSDWDEDADLTLGHAGWEVTIEIPKGTTALHMAFVDPALGGIEDAGGLGYHASTEFPYLGPWLVWNRAAAPGDGILVSWETSIPCLGVLEYGTTEALGSYATGGALDTTHHVPVTGLAPGDTLHYRVWDSAGNSSEVFTYLVPEPADPHRFVAFSDVQSYSTDGRFGDTVPEIAATAPDAAYALLVGDLTGWDDPVAWWMFFHLGRDLWSWLPMLPVPGNHDGFGSTTLLDSFYRYFHVSWTSSSEPWYSLDFGGTHHLALCSNLLPTMDPGADQYTWVESDLTGCWSGATRTCDHVFAAFHVPPYNAGMRHFTEQFAVRPITAVFEGDVDWHVSGHEHLAQRSWPLRYDGQVAPSGAYGVGADDGVGYLALPSAGSSPGDTTIDPAATDAGVRALMAWPDLTSGAVTVPSELGFAVFAVDPTSVTVELYATGDWSTSEPAELIDSVTTGP